MICYRDKKPCDPNCSMYDILNKLCMLAEAQRLYIEWGHGDDLEEELV